MTNFYLMRIYENHGEGLRLEEIDRKFRKYLEYKKAKGPDNLPGYTGYSLRNELKVSYPLKIHGKLFEVVVEGPAHRFANSLEALRGIYPGKIDVVEFERGNIYRVIGAMEINGHGFGATSNPKKYEAQGMFAGIEGDSVRMNRCSLQHHGEKPEIAESRLIPISSIDEVVRM